MKKTLMILIAGAALAAAETVTGVVTDTMCGKDHSVMGVKPDSKCVRDCVKMDPAKWKYALQAGEKTYELSDQKAGDKFAGQKVAVTGKVSGNRIQVEKIAPAK